MSKVVAFKEYKYERYFTKFYSRMSAETIVDLIGFSNQQGDFRQSNDTYEKARLRALLKTGLKKSMNEDYRELLNSLMTRVICI